VVITAGKHRGTVGESHACHPRQDQGGGQGVNPEDHTSYADLSAGGITHKEAPIHNPATSALGRRQADARPVPDALPMAAKVAHRGQGGAVLARSARHRSKSKANESCRRTRTIRRSPRRRQAPRGPRPQAGGQPEGKPRAARRQGQGRPSASKSGKHKTDRRDGRRGPQALGPPRLKVLFDERSGRRWRRSSAQEPDAARLSKITITSTWAATWTDQDPAQREADCAGHDPEGLGPEARGAEGQEERGQLQGPRRGVETAAMVTMRRERMWHFWTGSSTWPRRVSRIPRPAAEASTAGNYSIGLQEQGVSRRSTWRK